MQTEINEVEINGTCYVRKGSEPVVDMSKLSLVRSETAGVFFGVVESHDKVNGIVIMSNARRVWYWSGGGFAVTVGG